MIDPSGARSAAHSLAHTGATIAALTTRIRRLLPDDDHLRMVDRSIVWWDFAAGDLERRIVALESAPRPIVGPELLQGPPRPVHVEEPTEAAAFFARLSPSQAMNLAERFPHHVGPVDGAPLAVRYRANHLLSLRYLDDLRRRRRSLAGWGAGIGWVTNIPRELLRWAWAPITDHRTSVAQQLVELDRQIADAEQWADEDRKFLRFDPSGDGLIVEVLGELTSSRHVAVVIPGVGSGIVNYEQGLHRNATSLFDHADRSDGAVIAWLGYDTPDDLLGATDRHPTAAARALSKFLIGLEVSLGHPLHSSVIGHSYGSLVAGEALRSGPAVDEVVFIGSPGVGVDHVAELGLPSSTEVWAGRAASDPIRLAGGLECLDFAPICYPSPRHLFFGLDPTDPAFGATRFVVDDAPVTEAHSSYFRADSASLRNLTSIFLGQNHLVTRPAARSDLVSE